MSISKANISQIQQYLNGELDAKAMHRLEKQAQNDPFLMEALEGYQATGRNQQANLDDICNRFSKRVQSNNKRNLILWRVLPVAASVIIVLSIGLLWFTPKPAEKQYAVKPAVVQKASAIKQADEVIATPKPSDANAVAKTKENTNPTIASHITSKKKHFNTPNAGLNATNTSHADLSTVIANKAQSLDIQHTSVAPVVAENKKITGVITDPTGHALAGVKVAIKGTPLTAVTDTNGVFTIASPAAKATLNIAYAGFDTKQVPVNGRDSLKVVLNESTNVLATVSVPGYVDDKPVHHSQPLIGWKAFRNYIKKHAFMPNGETGRVKLAFTVSAEGQINGIRVIRGKSDAMNQKAIELVLNGPEWKGADNTKELKLKIRFRKYKNT